MATHQITIADFLSGKGLPFLLQTGESHVIVVRRKRAHMIEFSDALFRFNSAVVLPAETSPSSDGIARAGLDMVAACLFFAQNNPAKSILVAGHTDTVGSSEANVRLSGLRAQAVHGLLMESRDGFAEACFGPHLTQEQRYPNGGDGSKAGTLYSDYADVLNWLASSFGWNCECGYPNQPPWIYDATLRFQKAYNTSQVKADAMQSDVKPTGMFDQPTWAAVFDCYQAKLAEILCLSPAELSSLRGQLTLLGSVTPYASCAEYKPLDHMGVDNFRSQTNRRVEVLFFDSGEEPHAPCLSEVCVPADCDAHEKDAYRREHVPDVPRWMAVWDQALPIKMGDARIMRLKSPDLVAGTLVTFQRMCNVGGRLITMGDPVEVEAGDKVAEAPWSDWFSAELPGVPQELKQGQSFRPVRFSFVAQAAGSPESTSPELSYADAVSKQYVYETPDQVPAAGIAYTLASPWGYIEGKTSDTGMVEHTDLPPGGVMIVLRDWHLINELE